MKKLLSILTVIAATAAVATDSSNTVSSEVTFGIMKVTSSAKQTIIAAPWVDAGGNGAIKVKDLVKTTNLSTDDILLQYTCTSSEGVEPKTYGYKAWHLTANGWEAYSTVSATEVNAPTSVSIQGGGESDIISRGDALIIIRKNPTKTVGEVTTAQPIYLYGRYDEDSGFITVAAGQASKPVYTLIAPPRTSEYSLNDSGVMSSGTPDPNDYIVIGDGTMLRYNSQQSKWGVRTASINRNGEATVSVNWDYEKASIPFGQGVWYVSFGGTPTFSF